MFIDYAINDICDADEMASFEVDVENGGSTSYWSSYNSPAAIKLVHAAQAEFNPRKRAALYAQDAEDRRPGRAVCPARLSDLHLREVEEGPRVRGRTPVAPTAWRTSGWTEAVTRYAARRLASAVFVALGVTVATFLLLHVEPGDPARLVLGEHAPPSAITALRHEWGLDTLAAETSSAASCRASRMAISAART